MFYVFKIPVKLGSHVHYSYFGPGPPAPNLEKYEVLRKQECREKEKKIITKIVNPKLKDVVSFC